MTIGPSPRHAFIDIISAPPATTRSSARDDAGGREIDRADARTTETIDRHAAGADVVAGVERRHPPEVAALWAHLRRRAPDDISDIRRVDQVALGDRLQHHGAFARNSASSGVSSKSMAAPFVRPRCVEASRR
jgi:hypothetical protein